MGMFTDDYGIKNTVLGLSALLAGGVLMIGGCNVMNNWKYSEGDRVGMVNKISKKGALWETYEGQMALEGISSSGQSLGANVWDFAIDNYLPESKRLELADKVRTYMDSGQKVKIHYVEMVKTLPWRSESDHLIQSIEPILVSGRIEQNPAELGVGLRVNLNGTDVYVDKRHYVLKHDADGKLKVLELKEVQ